MLHDKSCSCYTYIFAVRQLADEYVKAGGTQNIYKEQHVLEAISTILLQSTAKRSEKVYEMLKMAAEVLEFDYAYLIGFNEGDRKQMFSVHIRKVMRAILFPIALMKVKMATLPLAKVLIDRGTPMM